MSTVNNTHQWYEDILQQAPTPEQNMRSLQKLRSPARDRLASPPVPNRKMEGWRYTWLEGLFKQQLSPVSDPFDALQAEDIDEWLLDDTKAYRIVFANGCYVPALTSFDVLPEGVSIGSLRQALHHQPEVLMAWFGQTMKHTDDVFTALNIALMNDGLFVHIKRDTVLDRPLEVVHLNQSMEQTALIQPCNLLVLEQGASAQIVERFISSGESVYFHNGVSEIILDADASLTHLRLQEESPRAYHLHRSYLSQDSGSHYRGTDISLDSEWARHELQVRFRGQEAKCDTRGLYLVGQGQLNDQHLDVLHNTPANTSRHLYKGILYGAGRAVFDGRILVNKDAQKTDARLNNHNLMLSRRAEVDTKPHLEIYADDVKCAHGTTVGQLDEQQLYYLRSRGIDASLASQMLCMGFAGEVLDDIELAPVRKHVEARLNVILGRTTEVTGETA